MSMTDPLGDMLTRIRNAQRAKKSDVVSPASRLRENVLEVLKREGYILGYEKTTVKPGIEELRIQLKYHEGTSVITEIYRVSTPGRRVYSSVKDDIFATYDNLSDYYNSINGAKIVSSTVIASGVHCTVFDNGVTAYVNYNSSAVETPAGECAAKNYIITGGAA
jgi:small subunit ribosomal protein S8